MKTPIIPKLLFVFFIIIFIGCSKEDSLTDDSSETDVVLVEKCSLIINDITSCTYISKYYHHWDLNLFYCFWS